MYTFPASVRAAMFVMYTVAGLSLLHRFHHYCPHAAQLIGVDEVVSLLLGVVSHSQ